MAAAARGQHLFVCLSRNRGPSYRPIGLFRALQKEGESALLSGLPVALTTK